MELGHQLEIIGALDQDAVRAGGTDAAEERQRNRDDQGARTGHNQKGTGPIDPGGRIPGQKRRDQRQGQGRIHDDWCIHPGEASDELLGL